MTDEIKKWLDKQPDIIRNIESKIQKMMYQETFADKYISGYLEKHNRQYDKALRFFFLMMFRQPAMCCTRGEFTRIVTAHGNTEYRFNGIPFAREVLEEAPLKFGEIRHGTRMAYTLISTLPIEKQAKFFYNIPMQEFHWNGRIFRKW